ncbi:hypothetical protein [Polaribacter sp. HL-MS24]|uniref:hypothetical protein n=1 Tax=Polaribacter sp. HL-MS24 TaxID=3077735 RepID=UPI0029353022|nr:hypothetical protein [Polaribacter sp. HL-MS24]WOC39645.1 hypothetical protein RRF69_08245 [Polaribacter sp. HL-MS24]
MDDSLSKLPKFKGYAYRGVRLGKDDIAKYVFAFKNKTTITERFFQSTSYDAEKGFRGNVRFILDVKSGRK